MTKVIVSVTNDIGYDQRVNRISNTLVNIGFDVLVVGRKFKTSLSLKGKKYSSRRFSLICNKGPLFYAEFNIRLFFFLLFKPRAILIANDLDTLLPNYLVSIIKNTLIVYDSHEYFTGVPELANRKIVRYIWEYIEKKIFPKLKEVYTVSPSIASLYKNKYNVNVGLIRNMPYTNTINPKSRQELNLPTDKKIILIQGTGINIDRGAEEAVMAMKFLSNIVLYIIGNGDVIIHLKQYVKCNFLENKVVFIDKLPYLQLLHYTMNADLGLALDKDTNINYRYCLPNKLFDFIQAKTPILSSPLVEIKNIIERYDIGETIDNHNPEHIAMKINNIVNNDDKIKKYKQNLIKAAQELCWETEEKQLINVFKKYQQ